MKRISIIESFTGDSSTLRNISRIIVLFGVCLFVAIWLGLYFKVEYERQNEIDHAIRDTANFARSFEEHTIRTIRSVDQIVLFLKYQYEREGMAIDIPKYINEGRLANQPVVLMGIIDENGVFVASSQVPFVPSNLKDREHFKVHKEAATGQLYISKPVLGRSSGKWSIQLTRRINKPTGEFGGVAVVAVDPFYFTGFYKQIDLGKDSVVTLIGRDGITRARQSNSDNGVGLDVRESVLWEKLSANDVGYYISTSEVDGVKRIYSYRAMREYPFVVVVGVSEQEVFESLNQRISGYYLVAGMATIMIAIFIGLLMGFISKQKRYEEELKKAHDNLEGQVEQRTQELFAMNEELTAMNEEHIAMNEELHTTNQDLQYEVAERKRTEEQLQQKNDELSNAYVELKNAQSQVLQQEKMASIGQLAAGVAHEINNPLGFVLSNFETLKNYVDRLLEMMNSFRELHRRASEEKIPSLQENVEQIAILEKKKKLNYILQDLEPIFKETNDGLSRVGNIVKALRLFSRVDQQQNFEEFDLNEGVKNTLIVARNEVKYVAEVQENLNEVPAVRAVGGQINQVLLNLIMNAAHAIKAKDIDGLGLITVSTYTDGQFVYCSIADTGTGIAEEIKKDVFNPFFTTKPVGQGTGLGLSISYDIIVNKHQGDISFKSEAGIGTTFVIKLPLIRKTEKTAIT